MTLREAIQEVQKIGQQHGFTIVIVGGALVRLIGSKTTIKKIDEKNCTITLSHVENPTTIRSEDGKTTIDIDCIAFSNESDPFTKEVFQNFSHLKKSLRKLQKQPGFPAISLEPVLYHPHFPKPNSLIQFVSSIESYHDYDFFFRLGTITEDASKASLRFWTYVFGNPDDYIISLNPLAIQYRYLIRGFSVKPKDKEKIFGQDGVFAQFVDAFRKQTKDIYEKDFASWDEFVKKIAQSKQPSLRIKRTLWNTYWLTIGNYLAHGTGIVGKILLPLGNTFFAGK